MWVCVDGSSAVGHGQRSVTGIYAPTSRVFGSGACGPAQTAQSPMPLMVEKGRFVPQQSRDTPEVANSSELCAYSHGEPDAPTCLPAGGHAPQDVLQGRVGALCLADGLRVVSGGEVCPRPDGRSKRLPDSGGELWPSV